MNDVIMSRKRWQQIFNVQMIITLIVTILEMIPKRERNVGNIFQLVCLVLVIGLNFYVQFKRKNPSKISYEINRWFTLWLLSDLFIDTWLKVGNYFLLNFKQLGLVGDVHAYSRGLELADLKVPFQPKPFYDSMILPNKYIFPKRAYKILLSKNKWWCLK